MMPARRTEQCYWCDQEFDFLGRGWQLCDPCREAYRPRCLRVANRVWQSIPWDENPAATMTGQYVDTRFLFELAHIRFQRIMDTWRRELLGVSSPLDLDLVTAEHAKQLVSLYAPRREPLGDTSREIITLIKPHADYFVERVRMSLAELVEGEEWNLSDAERDFLDVEEMIIDSYLLEWVPSGPVFLRCLRHAALLHVSPHRVFLQLVFGDSVVDEPWVSFGPRRVKPLRMSRPLNFGPYFGRFPPTRWRNVGLRQSVGNQIRVWTTYSLEMLGLTARESMDAWDEQPFHHHPFHSNRDPLDRTTSPAESNYARDKRWLQRRLILYRRPLADSRVSFTAYTTKFRQEIEDLSIVTGDEHVHLFDRESPGSYDPDI